MIHRLCVIGVGMIGGSIALELARRGFCHEIVGYDRDIHALELACRREVIHRSEARLKDAIDGADALLVAVPVGAMRQVWQELLECGLRCDAAIKFLMDVGSVKQSVIADIRQVFGEMPSWYVPAHPIAGIEHNGVEHAQQDLFVGKRVILTPVESTSSEAVKIASRLWEALGAYPESMSAVRHDKMLAASSHLPHVIAYGLLYALDSIDEPEVWARFSGGGLRDFTRVCATDPTMWRDICVSNRLPILDVLRVFETSLSQMREAMEANNADDLQRILYRAHQARNRLVGAQTDQSQAS